MDPITSAAVIGAAGGLINDVFGASHNSAEAEKNRKFQREEREATQQFNLDMWNMNNEYNSLSSQVDRAVDAGFSPNAVLDGGSTSSSPVTSAPMPGAQSSFNSSMSPVLANMGKTLAETNLINEQARGQGLSNEFDSATMKSRIKTIDTNVKALETTIKRDLAEMGKTDIETKTLQKAFEYFADMQQAELDIKLESLNNLRNQNLKLVEEIANTKKQGELLDENIEGQSQENDLTALKLEVSKVTGIPVGTPESDAVLYLWAKGKLPDYVRDVRTPIERVGWKPRDYEVPFGGYDFNFDPRKGVKSPTLVGNDYQVMSAFWNMLPIGSLLPK